MKCPRRDRSDAPCNRVVAVRAGDCDRDRDPAADQRVLRPLCRRRSQKTIETAMAAIARTNTRRMFSPPLSDSRTALTRPHHEGQVYEPARNLGHSPSRLDWHGNMREAILRKTCYLGEIASKLRRSRERAKALKHELLEKAVASLPYPSGEFSSCATTRAVRASPRSRPPPRLAAASGPYGGSASGAAPQSCPG